MSVDKRRVEVDYGYKLVQGDFIQWGKTTAHDESGNSFGITCALVEMDDGTVTKHDPKNIRFLDRS